MDRKKRNIKQVTRSKMIIESSNGKQLVAYGRKEAAELVTRPSHVLAASLAFDVDFVI